MEYVGIDLHKNESQICLLTETGEAMERRIRTEPQRFADVWGGRPPARILIEPSTGSEWVAWCLEALGHPVVVADPNFAPMHATRTRKVKTDRRDARALLDACQLGAYRPAHRLSEAQRHGRGHLAVRDPSVRTRTGDIVLIRAWLRQHGGRGPTGRADQFCRRVVARRLPGRLLSEVAPLLAVMRHVTQPLAYSDGVIATVTRSDVRVQRLRTVPRVGPVIAVAFVATIDDAGRFHRTHEVEAYRGLVPRSSARGRANDAAGSPKPGIAACAGGSSRQLGRSGACAIPGRAPGGVGPPASPRAAATRSPWSRWLAAWRASSTRYGVTGRHLLRGPCATRPRRRPFRFEGPHGEMADSHSEQSGTVRGAKSRIHVSHRFDGWVSAYVDVAAG